MPTSSLFFLHVRILLALVAEPALKAEGERMIVEAQERRRAKEKGLTLPKEGEVRFDTRKELSKLAGGCAHTVMPTDANKLM